MGFVKGNYIPKAEEIIDNAFKLAKKEADGVQEKDKSAMIKSKEKKRIKVAAEKSIATLESIVTAFPSLNKLNEFYSFMLKNSVDFGRLRKALGHLNASTKMIARMKNDYLIKVSKRPSTLSGQTRNEFYGRLKSIIKDIDKSLKIIKDGYKIIATVPQMKELPTILLIGLPNVGKSTLIKNITGSNVEIKDYPFTTKQLQVGYLNYKYLDFQFVDSPGLLDRPEEKQNEIEAKTIIALKYLANSVIYIVSVDENLKSQKNLMKRYMTEKPFILVFNKIKSVEENELNEFKDEFLKGFKIKSEFIFEIDQKQMGKSENEIIEKIKDVIYKQNKVFYKG